MKQAVSTEAAPEQQRSGHKASLRLPVVKG
ncbi:hypothetical protein HaLaN_07097 [Haematococcus lacustris]|uniref:Uncharacterized protein n=1 Tax=Haematococcus lacustris TaxID=44745 RepID=A0A699YMR4_HAELA|nr:hypothetical protein HaLaN_07097 [Haematococcus lacustris]